MPFLERLWIINSSPKALIALQNAQLSAAFECSILQDLDDETIVLNEVSLEVASQRIQLQQSPDGQDRVRPDGHLGGFLQLGHLLTAQ